MSTTPIPTAPEPTAVPARRPAATTRLGAVQLTVTNLDRSIAFYQDALGLRLQRREDPLAAMGAGGEDLVVLVEEQTAGRAGRHAGLYHFALLVPTREELARALQRLAVTRTPIDGASDHGISEAIYLPDPDGNGIEIAADRPREVWPTLETLGRPNPLDLHGPPGTRGGAAPARPPRPARPPGRRRPGPPRRPRHDRRPRAPARQRHRRRALVLRGRRRPAPDDRDVERRLRVGRRLPPPPRLQHLARRGHPAPPRPGHRRRPAPLDGAARRRGRARRGPRAARRRRRRGDRA